MGFLRVRLSELDISGCHQQPPVLPSRLPGRVTCPGCGQGLAEKSLSLSEELKLRFTKAFGCFPPLISGERGAFGGFQSSGFLCILPSSLQRDWVLQSLVPIRASECLLQAGELIRHLPMGWLTPLQPVEGFLHLGRQLTWWERRTSSVCHWCSSLQEAEQAQTSPACLSPAAGTGSLPVLAGSLVFLAEVLCVPLPLKREVYLLSRRSCLAFCTTQCPCFFILVFK